MEGHPRSFSGATGWLNSRPRAAGGDVPDDLVAVAPDGFEAQADWRNLVSPETYLGYERTQDFASPGGVRLDEPRAYVAPDALTLNRWSLSGDWTVESRASVLNRPDGQIAFRFHAADVNLVVGLRVPGVSVPFRVRLDGEPPGDAGGLDVDDEDGRGAGIDAWTAADDAHGAFPFALSGGGGRRGLAGTSSQT